MSSPQLLLTPVTITAVKALVSRGHVHPIPHETLYLRKVRSEDYKLNVPHGYTIHYDTGMYRPRWLCRHLAIKGPSTWSFIKKACSTMMDGMMILIMIPLPLMMLLNWQQNCRLFHGPHHTSHLSSPCMMGIQIRSSF